MSRTVTAEIHISCPPELVLDAFTEQQHLQGWWGVGRSLVQKYPDGIYALEWVNGEESIAFVSSGIVGYYEPGRRLRIEKSVYLNPSRPILGPMGLEVIAEPLEGGSQVTVTQSGYQTGEHWDWYYEAVKSAWPQALEILKKYLEGVDS